MQSHILKLYDLTKTLNSQVKWSLKDSCGTKFLENSQIHFVHNDTYENESFIKYKRNWKDYLVHELAHELIRPIDVKSYSTYQEEDLPISYMCYKLDNKTLKSRYQNISQEVLCAILEDHIRKYVGLPISNINSDNFIYQNSNGIYHLSLTDKKYKEKLKLKYMEKATDYFYCLILKNHMIYDYQWFLNLLKMKAGKV